MQQDRARRLLRGGLRPERLVATLTTVNPLHPKKLLASKWTAVDPVNRQKHFVVTKVHSPESPQEPVEWVDLEAVLTRRTRRIDWRELRDDTRWRQGWA